MKIVEFACRPWIPFVPSVAFFNGDSNGLEEKGLDCFCTKVPKALLMFGIINNHTVNCRKKDTKMFGVRQNLVTVTLVQFLAL